VLNASATRGSNGLHTASWPPTNASRRTVPSALHTLHRHSLATRRSTPVRGTPRTAHSLSAPARLAVGSRDAATCMSRVPGETSPHRACAALSFESRPCGARCRWEGRCGEQITFLRKRCILLSLGTSRPCRGVDAYKIPPLTESPRRGSVRLAPSQTIPNSIEVDYDHLLATGRSALPRKLATGSSLRGTSSTTCSIDFPAGTTTNDYETHPAPSGRR
jgi:hypothetical protein